jgi:hypothetical protein
MEIEDGVDLHGLYIGLELSENAKTTQTRVVAGNRNAALR